MEDAVEKDVAGLAEQIIQEDSERRAQELVIVNDCLCFWLCLISQIS
jgi:hypothetical protein